MTTDAVGNHHDKLGQFAGRESGEQLDQLGGWGSSEPVEPQPVGEDLQRIPVAQARRELPVGSRVQVVYLGIPQDMADPRPDVRTVTKQAAGEMVTERENWQSNPIHNGWDHRITERDATGNIVVRDRDRVPYVAYIPLDGTDPVGKPDVRIHDAEDFYDGSTSTDPGRLDQVACSDIASVRQRAASNAHTHQTTLSRLASDTNPDVVRAVVNNPHAPGRALDTAARTDDIDTRAQIAGHPNTDAQTLARLASSGDTSVHARLAGNPNTGSATLDRLSTGHGTVMVAVAGNPSTSKDTLDRLAQDTSNGNSARAEVAGNGNARIATVDQLVAGDDDWVRQRAASNPRLSPDSTLQLASDKNHRTRRALAGNRGVSPDVIKRLTSDNDSFVRRTAAKNPALRTQDLQHLARSEDFAIRAAVARNASTPTSTLQHLAESGDRAVALNATNELDRRRNG